MSRFYASIDGSARTQATRGGNASSGIHGHVRGWNSGVDIEGYACNGNDTDIFKLCVTHGSNRPSPKPWFAEIWERDNETILSLRNPHTGELLYEGSV